MKKKQQKNQKKVFLCLPMKGKTNKEVKAMIVKNEQIFQQILYGDIKFVNNFNAYPKGKLTENNFRLMCCSIGIIRYMIPSEIVCFGIGWSKSRGCLLEALAAYLYGKKIYAISNIDNRGIVNVVSGDLFRMTLMDAIDKLLKGGDIT